jgi:hypothetical protein
MHVRPIVSLPRLVFIAIMALLLCAPSDAGKHPHKSAGHPARRTYRVTPASSILT